MDSQRIFFKRPSDRPLRPRAVLGRPSPASVRWNTPFYGIEGQGWFLGFHCFTKYVKVAFFRGASLRPLPPVESKQKEVRYLHIHEDDQLDDGARGELDQAGIGAARRESLLIDSLKPIHSIPIPGTK